MTGNLKSELRKYRYSYTAPASISLAEKHQKTVKFGYKPPVKISDNEACECCNMRVHNEEISICENV